MTIEFKAWGKTPRLFRDIVITEKIDGTNSAVIIQEIDPEYDYEYEEQGLTLAMIEHEGSTYAVAAQSRNRIITPGKTTDNYGFAAWVQGNAERLVSILGPGRHFGEWWGQGVARKYDMPHKVFSLFNTSKGVMEEDLGGAVIGTVPVLYEGAFDEDEIDVALMRLRRNGSVASPGFMNPEGICVYHTQSKQVYKVTLDNNDKGKWETL